MVLAGAGLVLALMDDTPGGCAPGTSLLPPADAPAGKTQEPKGLHGTLSLRMMVVDGFAA